MSDDRRPLQDTINLQIRDERTVTNDTVRITVPVTALISDDAAEETIRSDIRKALQSFISDADWQFNNITRSPDGTGHEQISLSAVARVSERENHKLAVRARDCSRPGLQIGAPYVDTAIPPAKLEEAERALRISLVGKAVAEQKALSEAAGRSYRIHSILFNNHGDVSGRKSIATSSYGSGFALEAISASGEDSLSNAQKLSISAEVILAVNHDWV